MILPVTRFIGTGIASLLAFTATEAVASDTLEQALRATGWSVERKQNGDLILVPPSAENTGSDSPITDDDNLDLESMSRQLEGSGWNVTRETDGSLILLPGTAVTDRAASAGQSQTTADKDHWPELRSMLEAAGWKAERTSDGSIVLTTPEKTAAPATHVESTNVALDPAMVRELHTAGWKVSEHDDGTVLLHPPGRRIETGTPDSIWDAAAETEINLPVDTWKKAHELATSWLTHRSDNELLVGKIRKVLHVYIVSIVGSESPHRLRHQIAIRRDDGRVIVLH